MRALRDVVQVEIDRLQAIRAAGRLLGRLASVRQREQTSTGMRQAKEYPT